MSALHVLFKVGDESYVLPASDVLHMESFSGATRVPGAPPFVAGLVQVRRKVIPVVDLRARFGLPPIDHTLDARVIVVQDGARLVALLADSAREVVSLSPEQFEPPPEVIARRSQGYIDSVARTGDRLVMRIVSKKVIGEEIPDGEQRN